MDGNKMTPEQEANLDMLLRSLRVSDPKVAAIKTMEALGILTLIVHWLRGMFNVLETSKAISMTQGQWDNFHLLRDSIETWEQFCWRIVPPRAMTHAIGVFRENGFIDPEFEKLLSADGWGRASDRPDSGEIHDILGNIMGHDTRVKPQDEREAYGGRT